MRESYEEREKRNSSHLLLKTFLNSRIVHENKIAEITGRRDNYVLVLEKALAA